MLKKLRAIEKIKLIALIRKDITVETANNY